MYRTVLTPPPGVRADDDLYEYYYCTEYPQRRLDRPDFNP